MDIENRIKDVMSKILDVPAKEINDSSSPDTIESWDSLKQMSLIIALEEEFNIQFQEDQISDLLNYKLFQIVIKETLAA